MYTTKCTKKNVHIQNSDTVHHGVLILARIHLKDKHMNQKIKKKNAILTAIILKNPRQNSVTPNLYQLYTIITEMKENKLHPIFNKIKFMTSRSR